MTKTIPEPAIEAIGIHKEFVLPQSKTTSLKQAAVNIVRENKKTTQKVLNDVSFTINKGEFFGIVGRNGSGKSTLLKMLAGVYTPTKGEIKIHGGLTPFIELGVGFNPELSGRDNVYLNGALLGYTHKQMDAMYDEIVDFAELGPFMDQKLKNYSSGMQVRLAFSIAIKAKNDILIFDEVLAVGDEAFQKKCMDIFKDYRRNKQTVILVTHSMDNVRSLCTRALMLENGKIVAEGPVEEVADAYQKSNEVVVVDPIENINPNNAKGLRITGHKKRYTPGDTLSVKVDWPSENDTKKVAVSILNETGTDLFGCNSGDMKLKSSDIELSIGLNLGPGTYCLAAATFDEEGNVTEYVKNAASFVIDDDYSKEVGGLTRQKYSFSNSSHN